MPKGRRRRKPRPDTALALTFVREVRELEQTEVAEILEVTPGTVSDYERGEIAKSREEADEIAAKVGQVSPQAMDVVFEAITAIRRGDGFDPSLAPIPIPKAARAALARIGAEAYRKVQANLIESALAAQVRADRRRALRAWEWFEREHPRWNSDPAGLRRAIESLPELATWAFADLLAERSLATAPELPKVALVLGELALRAAESASASEVFLSHLRAKALAAIGNARRVLGLLPDSERAFLEARHLWPEGAPSPGGILSEARLFDLEASLRRDQRRFAEAHERLDRAFALNPGGPARGRLYLKQSLIFEQEGNFEGSIGALREAVGFLGEECVGRSRLGVLFNLALNLDQLGRSGETLELMSEIRALATSLRSGPDLFRVLWLETRARIAKGDRHGVDRALNQVRRGFKEEGLLHDAALAGLDLAILYLEDDRTKDTRELAVELTAVFGGMGMAREQLASVWLFLESAQKEAATADLARQAAAALRASFRARATSRS